MDGIARFIRVLGAMSLVASLLVGAFGVSSVAAQGDSVDPFDPVGTDGGVYFPWVANNDESTGLGPADTSITIQNLDSTEALITVYRGLGNDSLPGDNGWEIVGPFVLEAFASKTFSAGALGIDEGEGAPIAVTGLTFTGEVATGNIADYNEDGDYNDYEIVVDDDNANGGNSWINTGTTTNADGTVVTWSDGDCLVVDIDPDGPDADSLPDLSVYPPGYTAPGEPDVPGGTFPGQPGANLDGNAGDCGAMESEGASDVIAASKLAGVAKQAVDGENLPYTSDADTAVSGYNGLAGWELREVGNESGPYNGWYLPVVQTNGGPGGAWNSIIRVANFGDVIGESFIGAAGVVVTFYPADDAAGDLNQSFSVNLTVNAGQTMMIDLSDRVPEGWVGSAHISADAPVFAMVDRVKVGYNMWITNTASNAVVVAENSSWGQGGKFVLFAPDVRKDFFGWNTGINVANLADHDNTVTIQYLGDIGTGTQTATLHSKGMTYFYDPSQPPQDNNAQDPTTDPTANSGEIGAAILIADYPIAAAIDATKYPESTTSTDPNIFQGLSYSATHNLWFDQSVPLVQKGNPDTGMGATSGIQLFNPNDSSTQATVTWYMTSGDTAGNPIPVVINPNSMTFVYSMTDAQLSVGFLGSATIDANNPIAVVSTQVDYQVQFDGSAVWNGYNPTGNYRDEDPVPDSIMDGIVGLFPAVIELSSEATLQIAAGAVPAAGVTVNVYAEGDCGNDVLYSGVTDENGEVEIAVEPGTYCVGADPNNDLIETYDEGVYIDPGDTNLDTDFEIYEEAVLGILDVTVEGTQCLDENEELVDCGLSLDNHAQTIVYYAPVDSANVLCRDVDYTTATTAVWNPADDTFEAEDVVGNQLYCAMADLDGDPTTIDHVYSDNPFFVESNDPNEPADGTEDDHLSWSAALDVQVNGMVGEAITGLPGIPVNIFTGLDADSNGLCDDTTTDLGIFMTDAMGHISIPVLPGDYCAQITGVGTYSGDTDAPLLLGDPAGDEDVLIEITSVADLQTQGLDCAIGLSAAACDQPDTNVVTVIELVRVEGPDALCSTDPADYAGGIPAYYDRDGDTDPGANPHTFEASVIPGYYCAIANRLAGLIGQAFSTEPFQVEIGDPENDLDEMLGARLDAVVTENGDPLEGVTVTFFTSTGGDGTDGCDADTALAAVGFTNANGKASIFVTGDRQYCAQIMDGATVSGMTTEILPVGDANDEDITINVTTNVTTIADVLVVGADCVDGEENPVDCAGISQGATVATTVMLIPVDGPDAICPTTEASYTGADAIPATYDAAGDDPVGIGPTFTFEAQVDHGYYCAMADKGTAAPDSPLLFSDGPFEVTLGDVENDLDETLGGFLDIDVTLNSESLTEATNVEVFLGACGTGEYIVTLTTDATGYAVVVVNPSDYCAQANPNEDGTSTTGTGTVDLGDPADDGDILINEDAVNENSTWLSIETQVDGQSTTALIDVQIFSGGIDDTTGLCEADTPIDTLKTDGTGHLEVPLDPGDYCAQANPDGLGAVIAAAGVVNAVDPQGNADIVINEDTGWLSVTVQLDGSPLPVGSEVQVQIFAGSSISGGQCEGDLLLTLNTGQTLDPPSTMPMTGTHSEAEVRVPIGAYCAEANPNGGGTVTAGAGEIVAADAQGDDDIIINEVASAALDVKVSFDFGVDGDSVPPDGVQVLPGISVEIFEADDGDSTTACAGTSLGDYTTDVNGVVSITASPGDYCAEADPNNDGTDTIAQTDESSTTLTNNDPSFADSSDIDLPITEEAAFLSVLVQLDGQNLPDGLALPVQIFAGSLNLGTGLCAGTTPLYTLNTGQLLISTDVGPVTGVGSKAEVLVAPGTYCAQADPNTDGTMTAGFASMLIGDDPYDADITIDEDPAWLSIVTQINGDNTTDPVDVKVFSGNGTTNGLCDGTQIAPSESFQTNASGLLEVPVGPGHYCAQADPLGDGTATAVATSSPLVIEDPAGDADITINEDAVWLSIETRISGVNTTDPVDVEVFSGNGITNGLCNGTPISGTFQTDGSGVLEVPVGAGGYCAQADPGGNTVVTAAATSTALTSSDPQGDADIVINEVMGVADIALKGFDCINEDSREPVGCARSGAIGASTASLWPASGPSDTCPTDVAQYTIATVQDLAGDDPRGTGPRRTFEATVEAGWYCATGDKGEIDLNAPPLFSAEPFEIVPGDVGNDLDDRLGERLFISMRLDGSRLTESTAVHIFDTKQIVDGRCTGQEITNNPLATGSNGNFFIWVNDHPHCAEADPNGDGIPTAASSTFDDDDNRIEIRIAEYSGPVLNMKLTTQRLFSAAHQYIDIYAGDASTTTDADGNTICALSLTQDPDYRKETSVSNSSTSFAGVARQVVEDRSASDFCFEVHFIKRFGNFPDEGDDDSFVGIGAVGITGIAGNDPDNDLDVTIHVIVSVFQPRAWVDTWMDLKVLEAPNDPAVGVEVRLYRGGPGETCTDIVRITATSNNIGVVHFPVKGGAGYCVEATINGTTVQKHFTAPNGLPTPVDPWERSGTDGTLGPPSSP